MVIKDSFGPYGGPLQGGGLRPPAGGLRASASAKRNNPL
jgi:hypothetical protein